MEQSRLTLVREKGKDLPPLVVESALLNYGAHISVAYAHAEGGVPAIEVFHQSLKDVDHAEGALGVVKDILELTKDHKIVIHFSAEELDPQPYSILVDEKGQPSLVAFLIGDFSEYQAEKDHTLAYSAVTEDLAPKLQDLFEKVDDDIPKLMAKLKEQSITRELSKMGAGDFFNCTTLASNGEILGFCRPKSPPIKHDWGSASGEYEAKAAPAPEPAKKPEPAPTGKAPTLAERLAAKKAGKTEAAKPALPPGQYEVKEEAKGTPMESLADRMKAKRLEKPVGLAENAGDKPKQALHVVGIPPVFDKIKNRRKWFAQRGPTGEVNIDFPDWATRSTPILVTLDKLQAVHSKQTVEELTKKFPIATESEIKAYGGSEVKMEKKAEPAAAAAPAAVAPKAEAPGITPAAQKQHLREKFLTNPLVVSLVDKKGQSIMDPTFLPAMEDKSPLFTEDLGLPNIHAADWWKIEQYNLLGSYSLPNVSKAAFQYKMLWLKEEKKVLELTAELAKLKGGDLPGSTTGVGGTKTLAERLAEKKAAAKAA